jgi:hypothetical protein
MDTSDTVRHYANGAIDTSYHAHLLAFFRGAGSDA